jgi:hypothetical protein
MFYIYVDILDSKCDPPGDAHRPLHIPNTNHINILKISKFKRIQIWGSYNVLHWSFTRGRGYICIYICMCVYIYIYIYIYICKYTYKYIYTYIYIYVYIYIYTYIYIYIHICIYKYICIYVYICTFTYTFIHIYIYTYIYIYVYIYINLYLLITWNSTCDFLLMTIQSFIDFYCMDGELACQCDIISPD